MINQDLENRIAALERQNRRMKAAIALAAIAFASCGASYARFDNLYAKAFYIGPGSGEPHVASFGRDAQGAVLQLKDVGGKTRVVIDTEGVRVLDANGKVRSRTPAKP